MPQRQLSLQSTSFHFLLAICCFPGHLNVTDGRDIAFLKNHQSPEINPQIQTYLLNPKPFTIISRSCMFSNQRYSIFPTLLTFMSYSRKSIVPIKNVHVLILETFETSCNLLKLSPCWCCLFSCIYLFQVYWN